MARMKFLCDADRCIECNACVTACKNENEVPWGINRRRVVTINDGKPGERSVSMACMHCTDAPCAAVCPVTCFYTTEDGIVLHSKDLCIGCGYCFYACPFGAPQYPKVGNFGSRGKMDKCTYCAGGAERKPPAAPRNTPNTARTASAKASCRSAPRCARPSRCWRAMATIIAQIYKERVMKRGYGSGAWGWTTAYHEGIAGLSSLVRPRRCKHRTSGRMTMMTLLARIRLVIAVAGYCLAIIAAAPALAQQLGPDGAPNPTASVTERADATSSNPRASKDRSTFPIRKASVLMQPAGRTWDYFHEVLLHWLGAIVILGMIVALGARLSDHGAAPDFGGAFRAEGRPLQRLRALLALADGGVLRASRLDRLEHYVREDPAAADDRARGV